MQAVAAEMNLAETAFARAPADGDHDLRWFTPTVEVDLCGHATLATAHVLGGTSRFHTRSGLLTCEPRPTGSIAIDLPATAGRAGRRRRLGAVLGLAPGRVVRRVARAPAGAGRAADRRRRAKAVPDSRRPARGRRPRHPRRRPPADDAAFDSVSRIFAPGVGIDEDPVTGVVPPRARPVAGARTGGTISSATRRRKRGGSSACSFEATASSWPAPP